VSRNVHNSPRTTCRRGDPDQGHQSRQPYTVSCLEGCAAPKEYRFVASSQAGHFSTVSHVPRVYLYSKSDPLAIPITYSHVCGHFPGFSGPDPHNPHNPHKKEEYMIIPSIYTLEQKNEWGLEEPFIRALTMAPPWVGSLSFYESKFDNEGYRYRDDEGAWVPRYDCASIPDLVGGLLRYVTTTKEGVLVSMATFQELRRNEQVTSVHGLLLDIDEGTDGTATPAIDVVEQVFPGAFFLGYGSFNDGRVKMKKDHDTGQLVLDEQGQPIVDRLAMPRYRVILPLQMPITDVDAYKVLFAHVEKLAASWRIKVDPSTRNPSRVMFTPRVNPSPGPGPWIAVSTGTQLLDLDHLPDGRGGHVNLEKLVQVEQEAARKARQRTEKGIQEQAARAATPEGRMAYAGAARKAVEILQKEVQQLEEGGCLTKNGGQMGRNQSVMYLGAQMARFSSYLTPEFRHAFPEMVLDAAEVSGLSGRQELLRQFDNGVEKGKHDGQKYLRPSRTTATTNEYAHRHAQRRAAMR